MDSLLDNIARILAARVPRRKAFRLIGGAIATAFVAGLRIEPLEAAVCTDDELKAGRFNCGNGVANTICCAPGTCCAKHGNIATCCTKGQCVCGNGTCASSTGGVCPTGCTTCA